MRHLRQLQSVKPPFRGPHVPPPRPPPPSAPASCAASALVRKEQLPRSTTASAPCSWAALDSGEQAWGGWARTCVGVGYKIATGLR